MSEKNIVFDGGKQKREGLDPNRTLVRQAKVSKVRTDPYPYPESGDSIDRQKLVFTGIGTGNEAKSAVVGC